jgi:hypothetical protein
MMALSFKKIFQFKITLQDIQPVIWRRIQVPENDTFWDLHVAIQDAMGWQDCHLHQFDILNPKTGVTDQIGIPADDTGEIEFVPGWECWIADYFIPDNKKAVYLYDFGDCWMHEIHLEKVLPRGKTASYPRCLDGERACPPEDCGGVRGYADLLKILVDPKHTKYEETREWAGEGFDPEHFDKKTVQFLDPQARLNDLFHEEEDDDDGIEALYSPLKQLNRKLLHAIWEKAKAGDLGDLDPEHRQLGKIMQEHADEFFNAFEFGDVTHDHEYDPDNEVNPFLHIMIHAANENQLNGKDPIEVYQFYNAMRRKKVSRHETLHLLGAILMPLVFQCLRQKQPFNNEAYQLQLKKYKNKNPKKILDLLDKEDAS